MWAAVAEFFVGLLNLFGFGKSKSDVTVATETGQKLGEATAGKNDAVQELSEIQAAHDAQGVAAADAARDPGSVRDDDGFATHS